MIVPFLCLLATVLLYAAAKKLHSAVPKPYFSPLVVAPAAVIALLLATGIPYETYHEGAHFLSDMIGPATVALAVPLYKQFTVLKKHALQISAGVVSGSVASIVTAAWLSQELQLNPQITDSLIPRSATTPIAMAVSGMLGGLPDMTALFALMTGILGMLLGPSLVKLLRIKSDIARGVLFGTSAHTAGAAKAFEFGTVPGSVASIAMIMTAFFTLCSAPWIVPLFAGH